MRNTPRHDLVPPAKVRVTQKQNGTPTMTTVNTTLGALYVDDRGEPDEPTALLWPSLFTDHRMWRHQIAPLREAGWRTLALDPPGHGRSPGPGRGFTMDECAEAAVRVLDATGVRSPAVVLGTSWGGFVAPRIAVLAPERLSGMALFNCRCPLSSCRARRTTPCRRSIVSEWHRSYRTLVTSRSPAPRISSRWKHRTRPTRSSSTSSEISLGIAISSITQRPMERPGRAGLRPGDPRPRGLRRGGRARHGTTGLTVGQSPRQQPRRAVMASVGCRLWLSLIQRRARFSVGGRLAPLGL